MPVSCAFERTTIPTLPRSFRGWSSSARGSALVGAETPVPRPRLDALPVVAVQRGMSPELSTGPGCFAVLGHLRDQGLAEAAALWVYEVTFAGRLLAGRWRVSAGLQ
jgi:hypothetical protein